VVFSNHDHADPTDREFIAVLRRRADPAALSIDIRDGDTSTVSDMSTGPRAFLAAFGPSVPEGEAAVLLAASERCMHLAYYDAALEYASRGRALADHSSEHYGRLTRNAMFALLLLGRHEEAEAICDAEEGRADPALASHFAYAKGILHARLYAPARRDYGAAKTWVEQSLAFTDRLPDSDARAVNHAFLMNTRALVELRQGRGDEARALMDAALKYLAQEAPGQYARESIILMHNRARLHLACKRPADALGDLTTLLEIEPSNSDAYFDRALIHQGAGRYEAARADYDLAIRWSPPTWEPHFNRAQVLTALGRTEDAIIDYDRVLVLHPGHLETLINRGRLHFEAGRSEAAEDDAAEAVRLDTTNARALCLRGLAAIACKELDAADRDLSAAIAADASLADAWANRATVHFKLGRFEAALADIDQALALREDPDIRHNRGRILAACAAQKRTKGPV